MGPDKLTKSAPFRDGRHIEEKNEKNSKLAVIFPGMGYHTDKPLLYYAGKLLLERNYQVLPLKYGPLPQEKYQAFEAAKSAAAGKLKQISWENYDQVLFVSKSIGTCVAGVFSRELKAKIPDIRLYNIFFTPTNETLPLFNRDGIAFSGTLDPLVDQVQLQHACKKNGIQLHTYPDANHSLETGDVLHDLENLKLIMTACRDVLDNDWG